MVMQGSVPPDMPALRQRVAEMEETQDQARAAIEKLSEAGCIFANGELFDGPLGPTVARRMRREIREGFAAMGEAVKERVMSTWRPAAFDPT